MLKKTVIIGGSFIIILAYLQVTVPRQMQAVLLSFVILTITTTALILTGLTWLGFERLRIIRANRLEIEKQSQLHIVTDNGETWVRDTNLKAVWRNLTGTPAWRINGYHQTPSDLEIELHRLWLAGKYMGGAGVKLMEQSNQIITQTLAPPHLLDELERSQRCLIVGASDSGKTTLLQWLVNRQLKHGQVVIIDPHAYPQKWPGQAKLIGLGRNYPEIEQALAALVALMTDRYNDIGTGKVAEMGHPRLTVIVDEWRAIIYNVGSAGDALKTLLTESRKAAFRIFIGSHSDRVKPLGIEGEGDLKENFTLVRLAFDGSTYSATIDNGNGPQKAILPGPFPTPLLLQAAGGDEPPADLNLTISPTPQEQTIIELYEAGTSFSEICRQTYGSTGGKQIQMVKDILVKFDKIG